MYAALNDMQPKDLPPFMEDISFRVIVNAQGRICLLHEDELTQIPLWVRYKVKLKQLSIVFDNGTTKYLDLTVPDRLENYLTNANRVYICLVKDGVPIEGYDTVLLNEVY